MQPRPRALFHRSFDRWGSLTERLPSADKRWPWCRRAQQVLIAPSLLSASLAWRGWRHSRGSPRCRRSCTGAWESSGGGRGGSRFACRSYYAIDHASVLGWTVGRRAGVLLPSRMHTESLTTSTNDAGAERYFSRFSLAWLRSASIIPAVVMLAFATPRRNELGG